MFLPENERPVLLGDYEELFQDRAAEKGVFSAVTWYWIQILITLPEFVFSSFCWSIIMIKNYLKVTIRTLLKNKVFSIINITSIALSISICLMIIIYINDWRTADQFQENNDRIFRIYTTDNHLDWDVHGYATTPAYLAPHLLESYPNIDEAVRLRRMGANVLYKRTTIYVKGYYADDSFFDVFNFQLKKGDPITALDNPFSIVLSEEYAQIFFGDEDPMGKILTVENSGNYTVTGILKDNDEKTHLNFKSLISFSTINSLVAGGLLINELEDWKYMDRYYTYIRINDLDNISRFDEQLLDIGNTIIPEKELDQYGFKLQNICDINLGKNLRNSTPGTKSSIDVFFIP
ncbi:MAG: ABC transporter permease, partial [bacterium]|nr:ABC transporter permease [bacterium]